jgi:hypothetical protein
MGQRRKPGSTRDPAEHEQRNQEVVRANRELAAYFKGQRTEREARAALKIIKAFVRDRERLDAADRPALPGVAAKAAKAAAKRKAPGDRGNRRRHKLRRASGHGSKRLAAVLPMQENDESPPPPPDERISE